MTPMNILKAYIYAVLHPYVCSCWFLRMCVCVSVCVCVCVCVGFLCCCRALTGLPALGRLLMTTAGEVIAALQ